MELSAKCLVFRNPAEIAPFFAGAAPFIDSDSVQVQVATGPALDRLWGSGGWLIMRGN